MRVLDYVSQNEIQEFYWFRMYSYKVLNKEIKKRPLG